MEWSPPYDWRKGKRPKEMNIREALEVVRQQLGEHLEAAVPVCTAAGKETGIDQDLLPALVVHLNEARGVAFLRAVKAEADRDRIRRTFEQAWSLGREAAGTLWGMLTKTTAKK
jgi:predicted GTPase